MVSKTINGILLLLLLWSHLFICSSVQAASGPDVESGSIPQIWVAQIQDTINPMVSEYLRDIIANGESEGIQCLIIELDTPGGVLESTHAIVQSIMNANVPIVVYVYPQGARAASAGMFITIAAHIAAMAPATNIGAAHPVSIGPSAPQQEPPEIPQNVPIQDAEKPELPRQGQGGVMEQKIINDTLAWARTVAENRHRNIAWVTSAIVESVSSTEQEALEAGVIDFIAQNRRELIDKINGSIVALPSGEKTLILDDAVVVEKPMTWRQKLLSIIINPTIAIYLLFGGLIGLYIELTHPGYILPGVVGAISLLMALFSMHTLPINYAGLFLMLLSFGFFIAEVKVQSYGVLTVGGIVALLLGASMLIDSDLPGMEVSMKAIIPLAIAVAVIVVFLLSLVVRSHRTKANTGDAGMVGLTGKVTKALNPEGQVFIHGEIWNARFTRDQLVPENTKVKVISVEGLTLTVDLVDSGNR
ncbi:nodulation protein NfeD [bacterium]|nr:nodulation protein NfeD [candidate division CSSED10-310 bacterium]